MIQCSIITAQIILPQKESEFNNFEAQLQQLSQSGKLILAKRNSSLQRSMEDVPDLDWISIYKENRGR